MRKKRLVMLAASVAAVMTVVASGTESRRRWGMAGLG